MANKDNPGKSWLDKLVFPLIVGAALAAITAFLAPDIPWWVQRQPDTINGNPKPIPDTDIIPENILHQIHPGVSLEYAKRLLGEPKFRTTTLTSNIWNFKNASIEIYSNDNHSIDAITLMKTSMDYADIFSIYPLSFYLGKLTHSDLENHNCSPPQQDDSSKHYEIYIICYFGNYGNYYHFRFGAYSGGKISRPNLSAIDSAPFNYVSVAYDENKTSSIFHGYLR